MVPVMPRSTPKGLAERNLCGAFLCLYYEKGKDKKQTMVIINNNRQIMLLQWSQQKMKGEFKVRDPKRIPKILSLLQVIWEQQPDVRFHQLISNLQDEYSKQNNGYVKKEAAGDTNDLDFFYLEDEQWEDFLETIVKNLKKEEKSELESNDTKKRTPVSDEVFEQRVKEIAELLSEFGFEKEKVDNFLEAAKKQIQASQKEGTK
jgi:uncharacterized protein YihD (DUF1040 family)